MNKYNKIMEKIQVTPEMHKRIMENTLSHKHSKFKHYSRPLSIVASLLICIVSVVSVYNTLDHTMPPDVTGSFINETYASKNELSTAVNFEVKDINYTPFTINETQYIAYNKSLAEINYIGTTNSIVFRMTKGTEDVSGDYNNYAIVKTTPSHITIKGNNNLFNVAIWQDNVFSYALLINNGLSEPDLMAIIKSIH